VRAGLDLQPVLTAAARLVRGAERLRHHAFVATCERVVEKPLGRVLRRPDRVRHDQRMCDGIERIEAPLL
jgi:hypothetical protein